MREDRSFRAAVGGSQPALVAWACLAALWNLGGVWQIARGLRAPGPTGSVLGGAVLFVMAVTFVVAARRWPRVFVSLAALAGLAALAAVIGAFVQDPALWPSETWRWAGIVLNGGGVAAAVFAVVAFVRWEPVP